MPILSQGTGYAILALGFVATAAGKPLLVRTIATRCDLPAPFLSKIINKLAKAGLVHTQRGVHGGVTLGRSADEITLCEVCAALDDPILEKRCMLGVAECSDARACPAHAFNTRHRERTMDFLRTTTIADVASFETQRRWGAIRMPMVNGVPEPPPATGIEGLG
tara:strand:- start:349 stop:840 length:492 start_codon:yes stop_codon:yes gene_type:complete